MDIRIRPVAEGDWAGVTATFNEFVESSHAAYPEEPVEESFFRDRWRAHRRYPFLVVEADREVVGFACLAPFHPVRSMRRSAVLTYFIRPEYTGMGIGSRLLERLLADGRELGVRTFLAHVSSRNEGSQRFHRKHGFTDCGWLRAVGEKKGVLFDMVWFQRSED